MVFCLQSSVLCDDDEINKAILWKRGQLNKAGEFVGDELKQTVNKIVSKSIHKLLILYIYDICIYLKLLYLDA